MELIKEAERTFRHSDPKFEFSELPIEIRYPQGCTIVFHGRVIGNDYHIWVQHGFYRGEPGTPECVAISLNGACDRVAVGASAQLLETQD